VEVFDSPADTEPNSARRLDAIADGQAAPLSRAESKTIYAKLEELYSGQRFSTLFFHYRWSVFPHHEVLAFVPRIGRIYDVGCGHGISSNYLALASPGREVIGIEMDAHRHATATATRGKGSKVRFINGDVTALEIEECDGILLNDVLHHLKTFEEQERLLERCYRLLRPGGTMVVSDINDTPLWKFAVAFVIDHLYYLRRHIPYRNRAKMTALLEQVGFTVESHCHDTGLPFSTVVYVASKRRGAPGR
jgi:2-polyprenyl-3-methyl-5-hydroxy-6-metoxy-1,4-benzoquinol methylase